MDHAALPYAVRSRIFQRGATEPGTIAPPMTARGSRKGKALSAVPIGLRIARV
jgi:hypothetical protein